MQDVQNIPNPDVNSTERDEDFGSHSAIEQDLDQTDIENPNSGGSRGDVEGGTENIPVPPDQQPAVPIENPPDAVDSPPIEEDNDEPARIV